MKFAEGVGMKWKNNEDGSIENLVYQAFHSKITLALQATVIYLGKQLPVHILAGPR